MPPFAAGNARKVAKSLDGGDNAPSIIAGLWTYEISSQARMQRLTKSLSAVVATSLAGAVAEVRAVDNKANQAVAPRP